MRLAALLLCGMLMMGATGAPRASLGPLLDAEKKAAAAGDKQGPEQLGAHRAIPAKLLKKGEWTKSNGRMSWRLLLESSGAKGLRLHVTGFDVGNGKLIVRSAEGNAQEYTGKGPNGNGDFWTVMINGDVLSIEFQADKKAKHLPFSMPEVSHLWKLPY